MVLLLLNSSPGLSTPLEQTRSHLPLRTPVMVDIPLLIGAAVNS
jgi:hypothetical protein